VIAFSRPFLPLFLHLLGAMTLVGAVFAVIIASAAAWRRPDAPALRRVAWISLVAVAIPSFVVMRAGAQWIYSKEGWSGKNDPTWLGIGFGVADTGLLFLIASAVVAYWWKRSSKPIAGRILLGLSSLYLVLLAVAWLAMSGKWG
jgi:hypothetical protein